MHLSRERLVRASHTPDGPGTLAIEYAGNARLRALAYGPGARWLLERLEAILGLDRPPPPCPQSRPDGPSILPRLCRRARGVRLPRTQRVVEMLTLIVLQQKVRGREAQRSLRYLVGHHSEPAPGPFEDLRLPLSVETLRRLPTASFLRAAVDAKRAEALREVAFLSSQLEQCAELDHAQAEERLQSVRGLGPWSTGMALLRGLGAPDAVVLGDYNLPHWVAYNLAGELRGDDARMLELLSPFRGIRGWALRWILAAGQAPPRRGPRRPMRPGPR